MAAGAPALGWGVVVTFERVSINSTQTTAAITHNISFDQTGSYLVILGGHIGGSGNLDSYWTEPNSFGGGTAVLTYNQLFGISSTDTVENTEYESITAFTVDVTTAGTATLDITNYATHYRSFCAVYRLSDHADVNEIVVTSVATGLAASTSQTVDGYNQSGVISIAMWGNTTQTAGDMEATYIDGTEDVAPNENLDTGFWYSLSSRNNIDLATNPQTVTFNQGANRFTNRDFHVFLIIQVRPEFTSVDSAASYVILGSPYTGVGLNSAASFVILDNP
ncbi:hypothetical protein vBDshPR2C_35 [Dinoroseobacter phage vBDshPR2C]|uniref:Uncharacterized protein n=1 Tax=Dinoroseobacter phage vBDshPR2C TaxID=1498169 RepID=A0A0A7CHE6_9CAUD|nr:hypothetical protein vBDshPR2C_35 [Dinoroseobacter phage vBDshPR2C]